MIHDTDGAAYRRRVPTAIPLDPIVPHHLDSFPGRAAPRERGPNDWATDLDPRDSTLPEPSSPRGVASAPAAPRIGRVPEVPEGPNTGDPGTK